MLPSFLMHIAFMQSNLQWKLVGEMVYYMVKSELTWNTCYNKKFSWKLFSPVFFLESIEKLSF